MTRDQKNVLLSVVVPVYNEAGGLGGFNRALVEVLNRLKDGAYEIIYCDDGSTDRSAEIIKDLCELDRRIRLISFSRNFGKEIATTAGINHADGQAVLMIDADGQHPVEKIPDFVDRWQAGAKVVIGVRTTNQKEGFIKRIGSKLFYRLFKVITGTSLVPGSTDFRLIDHSVQQEFSRLSERGRMTRVLIDWLGYDREYIRFKANPRQTGEAGYSFRKLLKLAIDSVVSTSRSPLFISAYLGAVILPLSILIGLFMVADAAIGDPLNINATGSAYLVVLLVFLVGVLLVSQGIIGMYLSHIHTETQNRPIYVIDHQRSIRIKNE